MGVKGLGDSSEGSRGLGCQGEKMLGLQTGNMAWDRLGDRIEQWGRRVIGSGCWS